MLVLKRQQRTLIAETFRELANIAAGALVFGRFLTERPFPAWWALVGVAVWFCLVAVAVAIVKRNEP